MISGDDPKYKRLRNIAGEIYAALAAITAAQTLGAKRLIIYYDYSGVEAWAKPKSENGWSAKADNLLARGYQDIVLLARNGGLEIIYRHVKAHSGVAGNERADRLAKEACK